MTTQSNIIQAWRIVEMRDGKYYTLFHGLPSKDRRRRSRLLPVRDWLTAERKEVSDGGPRYMSGFNVLPTYAVAREYLRRFTSDRDLQIVPVYASDCVPKPTNNTVRLARRILITTLTIHTALESEEWE
jgi:hypothetical protein